MKKINLHWEHRANIFEFFVIHLTTLWSRYNILCLVKGKNVIQRREASNPMNPYKMLEKHSPSWVSASHFYYPKLPGSQVAEPKSGLWPGNLRSDPLHHLCPKWLFFIYSFCFVELIKEEIAPRVRCAYICVLAILIHVVFLPTSWLQITYPCKFLCLLFFFLK